MSKYKIIKNLADTSLEKMKHPNSIENTRTKENEKLAFFFPNPNSWLFSLVYLDI